MTIRRRTMLRRSAPPLHAGAITIEDGGEVTIEIRPGEDSYEASEQNGIESLSYGPRGGSFVIVTD